jgi:endoribonuclease LACTB2
MTPSEYISPSIIRLELPSHTVAPFSHTNSYLIFNKGHAVLVDPGFYEESALARVLETLKTIQCQLEAILLTHSHPDHQEGISLVEASFPEMPVYVHSLEQHLVKARTIKRLQETYLVGDLTLTVLFTPGHSPGHVSFYLPSETVALVGDVVAGYGSTWIGVPDGDLNHYFASLEHLRQLDLTLLAPGHGPMVKNPYDKLTEVKQHRLQRLEQVVAALVSPLTLDDLCRQVYPDLKPELQSAASSSLLALLAKLEGDFKVRNMGSNFTGPYQLQ